MAKLAGVRAVDVSFATESMEIVGDVERSVIQQRLMELGYAIDERETAVVETEIHGLRGFLHFLWEQPSLRRALLVAIVVVLGVAFIPTAAAFFGKGAVHWLFAAGVLVAGGPVFVKGLRALIFARRVTIDLLMAVASIGALGIGATGEAITVVLLYMLGEALEAYSAERGRESLRSLMALQPDRATLIVSHGRGDQLHEHQTTVRANEVKVGDRVLVRPGERVPVDGKIVRGESSLDEAPVTGECMPVLRSPGSSVMAGTVNGEAALEVQATRVAADGTIARIARLVEQAQAKKSPAERFVDRFARWYTPAVVFLALLVVVVPVVGFNQPLFSDGAHSGWLYRGLALLIIACPCALVISIPVTVVSALTRLAGLGILVKGGAQLDRLADIRVVAFDKTGTLTLGQPKVAGILAADCEHSAFRRVDCSHCEDLLSAAVIVERSSEHPVAHAIVSEAGQRAIRGPFESAEVVAHPGRGVSGQLTSGSTIQVGTEEMFDGELPGLNEIADHAKAAVESGHTVMYVARDRNVLGYIGVQDQIRQSSVEALAELGHLDSTIRRVMLTGDNEEIARRIANQSEGIDEVFSRLSPEDKLNLIETMAKDGPVAMVGDGINDAPALARADVGIAMGDGGTAQAMETADVVLMQDQLRHVPTAIRLARDARSVIKQNIVLSLGLKLAFLALAIPGIATLWMAVVADVGATLLVTLNGMRLLRHS